MANFSKQEILDAIRRTAKDNDGKPLGRARLQKQTGIGPYDYQQYWAKLSDAQKEAGFTPNLPYMAYDNEFLVERVIAMIRRTGRYPTISEMRIESQKSSDFPFHVIKKRKREFINTIIQYCENKSDYDNIRAICNAKIQQLGGLECTSAPTSGKAVFEVYLFKMGNHYKIGKTNDTVRRGQELRIQLPERTTLIHVIKTDDPSGIEAYWHKRFESKKTQGEWFNLSFADVKSFKRWKCIV